MKASKIIEQIEKYAPLDLMLDFDFSGLNVGDKNADVEKVLVCLNVTFDTLKEAKNNNCQMIISHHPAIFSEELDNYSQKIVDEANKLNLILYSAHTNLDAAKGGINDVLSQMLDVEQMDSGLNCYRIGVLKNKETLLSLKDKLEKILKDNNIRTLGENKEINTVCISSGAGARDDELVELLYEKNIDVLIGGENKLSLALKMSYYNIGLIEIGHYNSEIICMDIFEKWLSEIDVQVIKSKMDINPYN